MWICLYRLTKVQPRMPDVTVEWQRHDEYVRVCFLREQSISARLCNGVGVFLSIKTTGGTTWGFVEFGGSVKKLWLGGLCFWGFVLSCVLKPTRYETRSHWWFHRILCYVGNSCANRSMNRSFLKKKEIPQVEGIWTYSGIIMTAGIVCNLD